ncbi:MAG: hypothetical protein AAGA36_01545 [Pseudomonadota bacterium]
MGYLFFELLIFLVAAFLLGFVIAYWIWARRLPQSQGHDAALATAKKSLEDCQLARQRLEREESAARLKLSDAEARITSLEEALAQAQEEATEAAPEATAEDALPEVDTAAIGFRSNPLEPPPDIKEKLAQSPFLDAPMGIPDDLMLIKGVGPKLAHTLDGLGVYHFFQIAGWTEDDIAKVDDKLQFKGRITRDDWVDQAKLLASGDTITFEERYGQIGENRR